MRKIIAYEKNPEAVITEGNSIPEEIAEALFASHPEIKQIVSEAKKKFLLSEESNPGWKEEITAASKKTLKNERLERKRRKRAERKQNLAKEKQRLDWLNENNVTATLEPMEEKEQTKNCVAEKEPSKALKEKNAGLLERPKLDIEKKSDDKANEGTKDCMNLNSNEENTFNSVCEPVAEEEKIVDPFFTTSSGEFELNLCNKKGKNQKLTLEYFNRGIVQSDGGKGKNSV